MSKDKPTDTSSFPALDFQEKFNEKYSSDLIISGKYNPPNGYSSILELEQRMANHRSQADLLTNEDLKKIYSGIIEANPDRIILSNIPADHNCDREEIIEGVSSLINEKDIAFHHKHLASLATDSTTPASTEQRTRLLEKNTNLKVNWVMSPDTIGIVHQAINKARHSQNDRFTEANLADDGRAGIA